MIRTRSGAALRLLLVTVLLAGVSAQAGAQATGGSTVRVTVLDPTGGRVVGADVTLVDAGGREQVAASNGSGIAVFAVAGIGRGEIRATAEGFAPIRVPVEVKRGDTQATVRLAIAAVQQTIDVQGESPAQRRDNGFTQTLTAEEIEALSDDPDEMADQLSELAGPGAQIYVDGFRGGRLPPKAQIQQIRIHSNSYSAEYHDAGMVRVEVITRPGMAGFRSQASVAFGPGALDARNAFAVEKGDQRLTRFAFNTQGPIVKGRTSLALSVDGNDSFTSRTIVAASPTGSVFDQARQPTDRINVNLRLVHQVSENNQVRAEYARLNEQRQNLGVGDFDLPSRAFRVDTHADTVRLLNSRLVGKAFSELKLEWVSRGSTTSSASDDPTVRVLDAFTSGGAGQSSARTSNQVHVEQNADFLVGRRHSLRAGVSLDAGWWNTTDRTNSNGTYTFASLADFNAGRPALFTRRSGEPAASWSMLQGGWYVQDDLRLSKRLSVGLGLRQEWQTHVGDQWNLAPRAAFTWTLDRSTVVRGGYGLFYDWFEANLYEQTVRVDGVHQLDQVVTSPTFPATAGTGVALPPSVIRAASLDQPLVQQASLGVERPFTAWMTVRLDYMWTRASDALRALNANAPVGGVRPNPLLGNITDVQSTGRRSSDRVGVNISFTDKKAPMSATLSYQWQRSLNDADTATSLPSNSADPDADWGPSAQDVRHRFGLTASAPLPLGARLGVNLQATSAAPYTITTGRDDNGDTVFNDRPIGVARNSQRGAAHLDGTVRLTRTFAFGPSGSAALADTATPPAASSPPPATGDASRARRYRMDVYAQVSNPFNYVNDNAFVGNQLSPFFGRATSAGPARRVELGLSFNF